MKLHSITEIKLGSQGTLKDSFVLNLSGFRSFILVQTEGRRAFINARIDLEKDQACLTVDYQGRVLNPLEAPKIDTSVPVEDLPLTGWDIHLLRRLVDDIDYERSGGNNIFTVVKKWEATG